jgi:hypothetical protein
MYRRNVGGVCSAKVEKYQQRGKKDHLQENPISLVMNEVKKASKKFQSQLEACVEAKQVRKRDHDRDDESKFFMLD